MENVDFNSHIKNIDKHISYLDTQDIPNKDKKDSKQFGILKQIGLTASKLINRFSRAINYVFGDHNWYDESTARDIVLHYINRVPVHERTEELSKKILFIYNHLKHLGDGKGSYADAIHPSEISTLISDTNTLKSESEEHNKNEMRVHKPKKHKTKVEDAALASKTPAEIVPKSPDDDAIAHHFTRLADVRAPDARTLMHVHGNRFGLNSQLEGDDGLRTMTYLRDYLQARQRQSPNAAFDKLIGKLSKACELEQTMKSQSPSRFASAAKTHLQEAFAQKQSMLIPGGWKGTPSGHRCVYEVIPESSGRATFRIYNSGAGISAHNSAIDGHKVKFQPYMEWKGIDKNRLLSDNFLHAIAEMGMHAIIPGTTDKTNYGERDVYSSLKRLLKPTHVDSGEAPKIAITDQKAGVCAMRAWFAVLRTYAEESGPKGKALYKRFKCDVKIQTLADAILGKGKANDISSGGYQELVEKSLQKTSRSIDKLYSKRMVGDAYLEEASTALEPVKEWLDKQRDQRTVNSDAFIPTLQAPGTAIGAPEISNLEKAAAESSSTAQTNGAAIVAQCKALAQTEPKDISRSINSLLDIGKKEWARGEDLALHTGMLYFINQLSTEEDFWKDATGNNNDKAKSLMVALGGVSNLFYKTCFTVPQSEIVLPERMQALHRLLLVQQQLMKQMGHKVGLRDINGYRFDYGHVHTSAREDHLVKQMDTRVSIHDEFFKLNYGIYGSNLKSSMTFYKGINNGDTAGFSNFVRKASPETIKAIAKSDSDFAYMPTYAQDAVIIASSRLPDWIKALRDTGLYANHLKHSTVGMPEQVNRKSSFNLEFKVKHETERSEIEISAQDINDRMSDKRQPTRYMHGRCTTPGMESILIDIGQHDEKRLISKRQAAHGMTIEDTQALLHIFTSGLRIAELLEYFTKNTDKLRCKDYQILFRIGLFHPQGLTSALDQPGIAQNLKQFIEGNLALWSAADEIQGCVFLLQCTRFLRNFDDTMFNDPIPKLRELLARRGISPEMKSIIHAEIVASLAQKKSEDLQPQDLHDLIVGTAYLTDFPVPDIWKEPITDNEVRKANLLHGEAIEKYLCDAGVPNNARLNGILKALNPSAAPVQWVKTSQEKKQLRFISADNRFILQPVEGQYRDTQQTQKLIPFEIRNHPHFKMLFQGVEFGAPLSGNIYAFKDQRGRMTHVTHEPATGVLKINQEIEGRLASFIPPIQLIERIKQKNDDEKIVSKLISRYLVDEYTHWAFNDDPSVCVLRNKQTDEIEYEAWISGSSLEKIKQRGTGHVIGMPSHLFANIEDPAYIHELHAEGKAGCAVMEVPVKWCAKQIKELFSPDRGSCTGIAARIALFAVGLIALIPSCVLAFIGLPFRTCLKFKGDHPAVLSLQRVREKRFEKTLGAKAADENQIKKVELPRFSLSFTFDPKTQRFNSEQFKGFHVTANQHLPQMGAYSNYIVLENGKGQRKVLMPHQNFKAPPGQAFEVLDAPVYPNRELEDGKCSMQRYFDYDIGSNGALTPRSIESALYLVQVLIAKHQYSAAAEYLKNYGTKLSAYSQKEAAVLQQICGLKGITKDQDGNAVALRTYAGYLLFKNGALYRRNYDNFSDLSANYSEYLNSYTNATVLKLEPPQEIFVLTTILQKGFDPVLYLRLRDLDPDAARALSIGSPKTEATKKADATKTNAAVHEGLLKPFQRYGKCNFKKPSLDDALITRPTAFAEFWQFYTLAVDSTPSEKQWLRDALNFLSEDSTLAKMMTVILDNPSKFSMPPVIQQNELSKSEAEELEKWRKATQAEIENLLGKDKSAPAGKAVGPMPHNITPANFQIELPEPKPSPVDISAFRMPIAGAGWKPVVDQCFKAKAQSVEFDEGFNDWLKSNANSTADLQEQQTYNQLKRDFNTLKQNGMPKSFELADGITVADVKKQLETGKDDAQTQKKNLELAILNLVNRQPSSSADASREKLLNWGGKRKPISVDEAIVYFAKSAKHPEQLRRRNPALTDADIVAIFENVAQYLVVTTHEQQRGRALETIGKLEKLQSGPRDPLAEHDLTQQLAADLMAQHRHDPNSGAPALSPHFLAFEYFSGVLLRPEQVQKIDEFLRGGDVNIVVELLMGFGKSKVLMPLLAMLMDNPLLIVPPSLFENVSTDSQRMLKDVFGKMLHTLQFDRNSTFDEISLQNILRDITTAQDNGECIIMTSKSFQSLMLKFIETYDRHYVEQEELSAKEPGKILPFSPEFCLMRQIINRFETAHTVIDEADSVLNVMKKVCFSLGKNRQPEAYESRFLSSMYKMLYKDPALKSLARLESDASPNPTSPALTEENYFKTVQRPIAERIVDMLYQIDYGSKDFNDALQKFADTLKINDNRNLAIHYLCRTKEHQKHAQDFFNAQPKEVQEILALAGQAVSQFLSHTLTQVSNEKYGVDKDSASSIAVPFAAANTPTKGSQFANRHITMMYTFQAINKYGISRQIIENEMGSIQAQAMREMKEGGPKTALESTKAWKKFLLLKGSLDIPLFNYKPAQIDALFNHLNGSIESKMAFVENIVIPQLELFDEQIGCNPLNLISFLKHVSGFTGTLWNSKSMHRKITPRPAEGIAAKTFEILFRNSRNSVSTIEEGSTVRMLEQLSIENGDYDVIIDAGGYFKQGSNLEIARQIAKFHKKPVVFYNSLGEQTITDGKSEMPLAQSSVTENDRITFLDQDHTTGADVRYKRNARAIMTVSRKMLKRDVDQGAWRLRGLDKLQRVNLVLSKDVEAIVKQTTNNPQKVTFEHIAQFAIATQTQQQSKDNFQSFMQQLWDIPQQKLIQVLRNTKANPEECQQIFKDLRSLWIKPGTDTCRVLYGNLATERKTPEIVAEEIERVKKFLTALYDKCPWLETRGAKLEESLKDIDALYNHVKDSLPATIVHPAQDTETAMEVEQEVEAEHMTQLETQSEVQGEEMKLEELYCFHSKYKDMPLTNDIFNDVNVYGHLPYDKDMPKISLKDYFEKNQTYADVAQAFSDLSTSVNVFAWTKENRSVNAMQLFGPYRTPLHFVNVEGDNVTLLSQSDACHRSRDETLYNLTLGYCNNTQEPSLDARKKLVKVKFLNGDSYYTSEELKLLEEWLKDAGVEKMSQFYTQHVLAGLPGKAAAYYRSPLQQLFVRLLA